MKYKSETYKGTILKFGKDRYGNVWGTSPSAVFIEAGKTKKEAFEGLKKQIDHSIDYAKKRNQPELTPAQEDQMLEEGMEKYYDEKEPDIEPDFDAMKD